MNRILDDREKRYFENSSLSFQNDVIVIKANLVGIRKQTGLAYFLVMHFYTIVREKYHKSITGKTFGNSWDGPYIRLLFRKYSPNIKKEMIRIESELLGRFIDIDVFIDGKVVDRCVKRKCFLCNNNSFYCIRNKSHTHEELIKFQYNEVNKILKRKLSKMIFESAIEELMLSPKLGSVCFEGKHNHSDMNYKIMRNSIKVIIPYLIKMFEIGLLDDEQVLNKIKEVGIKAENKMLKETKNVNTYKGLIYCLGILITAFGIFLKSDCFNYFLYENIFNTVTTLVENEVYEKLDTFGYNAYNNLNFGGIRKEVKEGFITLQKVLKLENCSNQEIFRYIVINCEDSVLLKRSKSIEKYNYYKSLVENDYFDVEKVFLENNLSCGGSCDLLVCYFFIKKLNLER